MNKESSKFKSSYEDIISSVFGIRVNYEIQNENKNCDIVLDWLRDVCHSKGIVISAVAMSQHGSIEMDEFLSNNSSILSPVSNSIRNGYTTITSCHIENYIFEDSNSKHQMHGKSEAGVFIIPNLGNNSNHRQKYCGFVLVKRLPDTFSEEEKKLFEVLISIASKLYVLYDAAVQSVRHDTEIDKMQGSLVDSTNISETVRNCLLLCSSVWSKDIKKWTHLIDVVKSGTENLLNSKNCSVQCCVQQRNHLRKEAKSSEFYLLNKSEIESAANYEQVFLSGKCVHFNNHIFVPLRDLRGHTVAVAGIVKHKVTAHDSSLSRREEEFSDSAHENQHYHNDFTELEIQLANIFCSFSAPVIHKLLSMKETVSSIQEASLAIQTLQQQSHAIEDSLAQEVASRLKLVETVSWASQILSLVERERFVLIGYLSRSC